MSYAMTVNRKNICVKVSIDTVLKSVSDKL